MGSEEARQVSATAAQASVLPADLVLSRISAEMMRLRDRMHRLQGDLSILIERQTMTSDEMRRLQALDEATQALDDLALSIETAADGLPTGLHLVKDEVKRCFRLRSLRQSICEPEPLAPAADEGQASAPEPINPGQFSWL